jgi:hypothetical protein
MTIASQLKQAYTFGLIAHEQDKMRAACQSKELMQMFEGRKIGKTPKGEASSLKLIDEFYKGWDYAHRLFMKSKFGF